MVFTGFNFYVYAYLDENNLPYYVGKGRGNRYKSKSHRVKVPDSIDKICIISKNISELWAFALERKLIQWYGRKDLGTGVLENRTNGGDGPAGQNHKGENNPMWGRRQSEESNRLRSISNKGKSSPIKGKKIGSYSEERRAKMSLGQIGRKQTDATKEKIRQARLKYWQAHK